MTRFERMMEWLADREVLPRSRRIGPDSCPRCMAIPFPAGSCTSCGYTRAQKAPIKLFSSNNLPAIIFVGVIWIIVLAALVALLLGRMGV